MSWIGAPSVDRLPFRVNLFISFQADLESPFVNAFDISSAMPPKSLFLSDFRVFFTRASAARSSVSSRTSLFKGALATCWLARRFAMIARFSFWERCVERSEILEAAPEMPASTRADAEAAL
jgi:hypothetical protein